MRRIMFVAAALGLLGTAVAGAAVWMVEPLRWRADILVQKAGGGLTDVGWGELLRMLEPGGRFYLKPLADSGNPYSSIANPYVGDEHLRAGKALFRDHCAGCHGAEGRGESGPSLRAGVYRQGDSDWALYRTISRGIPGTSMVGWDLGFRRTWQLVAFVRSLARDDPGTETAAVGPTRPFIPVGYQRLLAGADGSGAWPTYSGSYDGRRFSPLSEVSASNVHRLQLAWAHQLESAEDLVQTSPLVVDDTMYLTGPGSHVLALDAQTGERIWRYRHRVDERLTLCCGQVNRGAAVLGERVYVGTLDGYLVALDARTGELVWKRRVGKPSDGISITSAPLALEDRVVVGVSGGEFGIRGYLDAYAADDGERLWRFWTIPEPGRPGSETWSGDAWERGGGATWMVGSYDPELDQLYWGVGNPAPPFNGDARPGDNLFTNSVVALDPASGELIWHFQFTPHDEHDWDSNQVPVLIDRDGRPEMLWANKNGFAYRLDRRTGEYLQGRPFARQTWTELLDDGGRPILAPNSAPSPRGTLIYPGPAGATNWWPSSYSPSAGLWFVPTLEQPKVYFKSAPAFAEGELFLGSTTQYLPAEPHYTALRALDPVTLERRWEVRGHSKEGWSGSAGTLATAGGLVFWGDGTQLHALEDTTGRRLWSVNLGGRVAAPPVSYAVDGRQHVAIVAGRALMVFALPGR